jgi:hypothetical protein
MISLQKNAASIPIRMKTSAAILLTLGLISTIASAQVPGLMSYQGKVVDNTGTGLGTGTPINRKILFRIFDAGTGGNRLWSEEQTVTLSNGDFSVVLGQGINASYNGATETPRPSLLTVFTGTDRYLEIIVDNGDGALNNTDTPITPRQRLISTAFAIRAATADSVASGTDLNLRDANHGLGWYGSGRPFNGINLDGPALYGFGGGALGSVNGSTQNIALRWTNTGSIGIGTATPAEKLDVVGNAKISGSLSVGGMGTFGGGAAAPTTGSGGTGMRLSLYPGDASATPFGFGIDNSTLYSVVPSTASHKWYGGTTERMSLNGSNGILSVGADLVVGSYSNSDRFINVRTTGGNVARSGINFHHHDGSYGWSVFSDERNTDGYGFHINSLIGGTVTSRLFIDTGGNVGIGTKAPTTKLDVVGGIKSSGGLSFGGFGANATEGGSSGNFISFSTPGFSEDFIGYANNKFYMKDSPGGADVSEPDLVVGGKITAKDKPVATGEEELRIIRGVVVVSGGVATIDRGTGFTVTRNSTGTYYVSISNAFSGNLTPTVTVYSDGSTYDFVRVGEAGTNGFRINIRDSGGNSADRHFSFIAVGPR